LFEIFVWHALCYSRCNITTGVHSMNTLSRAKRSATSLTALATALTAALTLAGCGGDDATTSGGGSLGQNTSTSSSASSAPAGNREPVVEAGSDVSTDAGSQVELTALASDTDGEIERIVWRQLSGPRASFQVMPDDPSRITLKAPSTGTEPSAEVVFEVTAVDDAGASASDSVTVSVNRINQRPVVELGGLRTVPAQSRVELTATTYDLDGQIESYLWEQLDGEPVVLQNTDERSTHFDASALEVPARLQFLLTVVDNDGAQSSDRVTLVVADERSPVVDVVFPPARGYTQQASISVFGTAGVAAPSEPTKVVVDGGVAPVTATLSDNGQWRADDVLLPEGVELARVSISAFDSQGRVGYADSELVLNPDAAVGYGDSWVQSRAMALAPDGDSVWVLADGEKPTDLQLLEIDLNTGERTSEITNLGDTAQGVSPESYEDMAYDAASGHFYLSSTEYLEATDEWDGRLIKIDAATGARTELALSGLSAEHALRAPAGLALVAPHTLYVTDNVAGRLLRVNLKTAEAELVYAGDEVSADFAVPNDVAHEPARNRMLVTVGGSGTVNIAGVSLTDPAQLSFVSTAKGPEFGPIPQGESNGLVVNHSADTAYMLSNLEAGIVQVDLASGSRSLLADDSVAGEVSSQALAYDADRELIYLIDGRDYRQQLMVVDAISGDAVVVSESRF
jgi:hypothetical protein